MSRPCRAFVASTLLFVLVVFPPLLQAQVLPRTEDATYLLASLRFFKAEYQTLRNVETYNLTEDFQMGPALFVGARWAIPTLHSSPNPSARARV